MYLTDKKKSVALFGSIFVLYTLVYMTKNCFSAAMASIVAAGVLTKSQTGFITAVFYTLYAPLQLVGGLLADRYNPTRLVTLSLLGGALANGVIFLFPHYGVMLAAWGFNAIIQCGVWPCIFKILSTQLHPAHRERAAFLIAFSTPGGLLLSFIAAAFLTHWQTNFALSAAVLCLLAGGFWRISGTVTPHLTGKNATAKPTSPPSTSRLCWRSGLWLIIGYVVLRTIAEMGIKTLSATMLSERYTVSPTHGNLLGALIILAGIIGTVAIHTLIAHTRLNELNVTLWLLILCLPLLAYSRFTDGGVWAVTVMLCTVTAALSGTHYLLMRANLRFVPYGKSGFAAGLTNGAASLGIILQSTVTTTLADTRGWQAVETSWLILIGGSVLLVTLALPKWRSFSKGDDKA